MKLISLHTALFTKLFCLWWNFGCKFYSEWMSNLFTSFILSFSPLPNCTTVSLSSNGDGQESIRFSLVEEVDLLMVGMAGFKLGEDGD